MNRTPSVRDSRVTLSPPRALVALLTVATWALAGTATHAAEAAPAASPALPMPHAAATAPPAQPVPPAMGAEGYVVRSQPLPKSDAAGVGMDYIAYDASTGSLWVPAGNTGTVAVIDTHTGTGRAIEGFKLHEVTRDGRKFTAGPSSVSIGEGTAYVGNRGDMSVCAFDAKSLAKGACHVFDGSPDGVAYVAKTHEVWVTTPRDQSIRVLDATTLAEKAKLTFAGDPEGFAVDNARGRFFTNLEDKDKTAVVDLASRKTVATWEPGCGEEGPRGLRFDAKGGFLIVACTAHVAVMDAAHDGKVLSTLDTGSGVDDMDFVAATRTLYAGAGRAAMLTIAHVDEAGKLSLVARVPTVAGARNPAATERGVVYLAHGFGAGLADLTVVEPKPKG
jgi:hypothetical protein